MRPLRIISIVSVLAVISLPVFVIFFISPELTRLVEANAREESVRVASHLVSMLISEQAVFEKGLLPAGFDEAAESVRKDFGVHKLKVFSPSGEVIYSSDPGEIGEVNREEYFTGTVAGGVVYSKVVRKTERTLEGETSGFDVAETYVPVMRGGRFRGAFEIYYDISGGIARLNGVMRSSYLILSATLVCLLAATAFGMFRTARALRERDLARKEWEHTFDSVTDPIMILDAQFRMTRVNRAMAELIGATQQEAIGMTCYRQVHCTERPIEDCPHRRLLEDGKEHTSEIYEPRLGRHYAVTVFPIIGPTGKIAASVHYAKDITKRKQAEEAHQKSARSLSEAQRIAHIGSWELDMNGSGLTWSDEVYRIFEVDPGGFRASYEAFLELIHPQDRASVDSAFAASVRDRTPYEIEHRISMRDGRIKHVQERCETFYDADGRHLRSVGTVQDITDRKSIEQMLQRQLKVMTALSDIGMAISSSLDVRVTLNILLERLVSQLGVDAADMLIFDPDTLHLNWAASVGFRTPSIRLSSVRLGKGHAGRAAYERRTIIVRDLGDTLTRALREEDFKSCVAVPLIAQGKVKGVLEIFHRSPLEPSGEWLSFLELMSAQAAIAIDNATMFESLQKSNMELTLSYDATLEGWGRTLEFRDEDTKGHTERVAEMTVRYARLLGMDEREIVQVRRGALLHDIGKIGIPDSILLKKGPLTEDEMEVMKHHPIYAYELLSCIPFLRQALDIPYCHHEKWDGTGYPRGLKGDEIPFSARIFSVVDASDALLSDRPYRKAWPPQKVRDYISDRSGSDFDPAVVEVFLKVLDGKQAKIAPQTRI